MSDPAISDLAMQRRAITLVELLTSLAIIGLLTALLLPAVQGARESARRATCQNHLRQLGLAALQHHDVQGHLPSDGWGWQWLGEANRGYGPDQPGGWAFNVLPFVEQAAVRELADGGAGGGASQQVAIPIFHCPSRRAARLYPYTQTSLPLNNSPLVATCGKTDYAINSGDAPINTPSGPANAQIATLATYPWPPFEQITGVSFVRTGIGLRDVTDGASNTLLIGEKYLARSRYTDGSSLGDDQSLLLGDDADIRRWSDVSPQPDGALDDIQHFGSAHRSGCHFVWCDGSVRQTAYTIEWLTFRRLGNRCDGH